jgi:hypothetical protein
MPSTRRLTMGQAIVEFMIQQYTSLDGIEQPFFGGVFTIFGHGNVAGLGQALLQATDRLPAYFPRNEQAMVHTAVGYAKMANRRRTLACTSSIGPGATNMLTGAAVATINRLPVLLLPGDIFAKRTPAPVLQQLESPASQDVSVNDCFRPVPLLGPDLPARAADHGAARGAARADLAGRDRGRDAVPAAGRADRGVRLPRRAVREAGVDDRAAPARRNPAQDGRRSGCARRRPGHRGRRRRHLQRGHGERSRGSRARRASRSWRRWPARGRSPSTIRRRSGRWA